MINVTAVCQQWRATLLSFPQVWRKAGGRSSELEAYLERSKSVPIEVNLSSPGLVTSIIPHASRLENLTVFVEDSVGFEQIVGHLCEPIPTLRSFTFLTKNPQLFVIEPPSGLSEGLFRHLENLYLYGTLGFRGSQSFPHITELVLCPGHSTSRLATSLLETLGQLPGLIKVNLLFLADWYTLIYSSKIVTLSCVEEIRLFALDASGPTVGGAIPPILRFLKLPKATIISVQSPFPTWATIPVLPDAPFSEHLPNYVNLPELQIETKIGSGEITFRSASQAVLTYRTGRLEVYERELQLWGGLPISSIRKVTAIQLDLINDREDIWLAGLLGELEFLELLELGGDCGHVLRHLRHRMLGGVISSGINALVIRGGEYAKSQAFKFDAVKGVMGLGNTTVTYIPDPGVQERYLDFESASEGEDLEDDYLGEGDESDEDGEDDDDDDDDGDEEDGGDYDEDD